jgi:hypothetical protein
MQTSLVSKRMGGLLLGAAMIFSLLLTGCGSQKGVSSTTTQRPTPTPTQQPTPTPTPTPLPTAQPTVPTLQGTPLFNGQNLIVNGNAESGAGDPDGSTPVTTIPGWTIAGGRFDVIQYQQDNGSYPAATDPGPTDRGKNFFSGGPDDDVSTGTQVIDVSQAATVLDTGAASYLLVGWLGGFEGQDDHAVLSIQFADASGKILGQAQIGPVLAADRSDLTELILRTAQGKVPTGTRKILVTLTMTRVSGAANDGYADNLSLVLAASVPSSFRAGTNSAFSAMYPCA